MVRFFLNYNSTFTCKNILVWKYALDTCTSLLNWSSWISWQISSNYALMFCTPTFSAAIFYLMHILTLFQILHWVCFDVVLYATWWTTDLVFSRIDLWSTMALVTRQSVQAYIACCAPPSSANGSFSTKLIIQKSPLGIWTKTINWLWYKL